MRQLFHASTRSVVLTLAIWLQASLVLAQTSNADGKAVTITSPASGSTESGSVTITTSHSAQVQWINFYVDGNYVTSSPPYQMVWNSAAVPDGTHIIVVRGLDSNDSQVGSDSVTLNINNASASNGGSAVQITSPSSGSTQSGRTTLSVQISPPTQWVDFYVDGNYLSASPPYSKSWDSTTVSNGNHTISARAFDRNDNLVGSDSAPIKVSNNSQSSPPQGGSSGGHFYTLPPGSDLPSGDRCAALLKYSDFEPRPNNYQRNHTVPTASQIAAMRRASHGGAPADYFDRVDGNFTGTTDEILQWGACKWGFDEDFVRALACNESWWHANNYGDHTSDYNKCPSGAQYDSSGCYLTYGLLQIKSTDYPNTFAASWNSTAFNVDYKLAYQRACFDGKVDYLRNRSSRYPSQDSDYMLWGCAGQWYSGDWYDSGANSYNDETRRELNDRSWEQPGF